MSIAPAVLERYPELTDSQRAVVGHLDGPLLVIAGPGSGKTQSIVLRTLNLLLLDKAGPGEIVLCTFTEKAAFEMRDRLAAAARNVRYGGDLSELTISTIHGFCNRVLTRHRHRTKLGHSYDRDDPCLVKGRADCFLELIGDVEERVPSGIGRARSSAMVFRGTALGSRMRASGRGGRTGPLARS